MVLTALLLFLFAAALCAYGIHRSLGALGLGVMQTLLWLGLAEDAAPAVRRKR